jgi:hypothetical protein
MMRASREIGEWIMVKRRLTSETIRAAEPADDEDTGGKAPKGNKIDQLITLTTRAFEPHASMVYAAVEADGAPSANVWIREVILAVAARKLGKPVPDFSAYGAKGKRDAIRHAALNAGLSTEDTLKAIAEYAAKIKASPTEKPPSNRSGTRKRVK